MVNFGLNSASILGIFLAVAGASLYFMRSVRPELSRDHDIFFAAVGLLCGFILLFQGWRLDPILQFGQFLLTGSAIFFAVESIRLRGVATEQARRNTPIVDRDRPVSRTRVYTEAELDKIDPYENYEGTPNYDSPRLRGYDDPKPRSSRRSSETRHSSYTDSRDEPRSRSSRSRYDRDREYGAQSDTRSPRRRNSPPRSNGYGDRKGKDDWDEPQSTSPRPRTRPRSTPPEDRYPDSTRTAPRRRPNPADLGRSYNTDSEEDYDRDRDYGRDSTRDYDRREDYSRDSTRDYDRNLGRSYDDEDEDTIDSEYVDYQPIDNSSDDYSDYPEDEEQKSDSASAQPTDRDSRRGEDESRRNKPIDFDY